MRWKDLLWVLAYPIYQLIGTLRHESAHAFTAIVFGGKIQEFVFLPTRGYWGYVRWEGPHNFLTTAAPYLLDLLTFLIFFTLCMQFFFRRRWVWLNLVILGVISPLINSAYNLRQTSGNVNDVTILLRDGNTAAVSVYFILSLSLYIAGLWILFTRAKTHDRRGSGRRTWTVVPIVLGGILLVSACSVSLSSSVEPEERLVIESQTNEPKPSPVIRRATMTPTMTPKETYDEIFKRVVGLVAREYPERAPIDEFVWKGDYRIASRDPTTLEGDFQAGDWNIRLFDWDSEDPLDPVDVNVNNKTSFFSWSGVATLEEIDGQLNSAGIVPKPSTDADEWFLYTNENFGYQFRYPSGAHVIEHGVGWIDTRDVPEGMDAWEAKRMYVRELGPNLCAQVVMGDGFIWFNPPENFGARFNFCQHLGPNASGWFAPKRSESVTIDSQDYTLEGRELIKTEGDDHDEALQVEIQSGMHIQVGVTTDSEGDYELYRAEVLPVLLQILETYESIPRDNTQD